MQVVDAELVDKIIRPLKDGNTAGLDSLTAELLEYCHTALSTVFAILFNTILNFGCIPSAFGRSYTVPLPKGGHVIGKSPTGENFWGISISHVLSNYLIVVFLTYMQLSLQPATTNLSLTGG